MKQNESNKNAVYIIAEIGINHCGDMKKAFYLIDQARDYAVNAVKFQTFITEKLVRRDEPKMPYQVRSDDDSQKQFEMLKMVELGKKQHIELIDYCRGKGIDFISTPYDKESADLLAELKVDAIKIASTDSNNIPFLRHVSTLGLPIIYSTGISEMWEIGKAVSEAFADFDQSKLAMLHCVSNYPAPLIELNLRCMKQLRLLFECRVGFSDHSDSLLTGAYAVCAGATIVEKHLTFDRKAAGPDHQSSLEPAEFGRYVEYIREAETTLGDGVKRIQPSEKSIKGHMQKSLVAAENITAGSVLAQQLITTMRPADGISPLFLRDVIGKRLLHNKAKYEIIKWEDLQSG